jgi:phosphatidate phosphatase PAH1
MAWSELARAQTSETGSYSFPGIAPSLNRNQPHYAILEGDGSCSPHYSFLMPAGTQVIVTDIDGTLTLADEELFNQIGDGNYVPLENMSAAQMMNTWADKGYVIVYLTARPHAFRTETRVWLRDLGYPVGPVITANTLVFDESARQYKRAWVNRVKNDFGWKVVAAYGNATSDIDAYEDAGIGKDITFIVGPNAGVADTQAIENNDYTAHIADFVNSQPDAAQP